MPIAYVTGANGCLGLNLIEVLLENNWDVIAAHREGSNINYLKSLPVKRVVADIASVDALRATMPENVDCVFHVAGSTHLWRGNDANQNKTNIDGTEHVARVALEKQAKRFVYTSSIMAYGLHKKSITEETISNALSCPINYCASKFLAEKILREYLRQGLNIIFINPCSFMGKYDSHNWARLFLMAEEENYMAAPPGEGMFADVKDIAKAHFAAATKGKIGENYLLGGTAISYRNLINKIQARLNKRPTRFTAPAWLVKVLSVFYEVIAYVTGKPPMTSYQEAVMLNASILCSSDKAKKHLDYEITH